MEWLETLSSLLGAKEIPRDFLLLEIDDDPEPTLTNTDNEISNLIPDSVFSYTYTIVNKGNGNSLHITVIARYGSPEEIVVHGSTTEGKGNRTAKLYNFRSLNKFTKEELKDLSKAMSFLRTKIGDPEHPLNRGFISKAKALIMTNLYGSEIVDAVKKINHIVQNVSGETIKYWLD